MAARSRTVQEREVKLDADPDFQLPDLSDLSPGVVVETRQVRQLDAVYFDTADLRLARAGITVRHRCADDGNEGPGEWTVKFPEGNSSRAGELARSELNFEGEAGQVPEAVSALVRSHARSLPVEPVARLRTRRRTVLLRSEDGADLIELDDDEVTVLGPDDRVKVRFREVEAELTGPGGGSLLGPLVDRLCEAGAEPGADPVPKVFRALGPAARLPAEVQVPSLGKEPSAADVVGVAIASGVQRIIDHDPVVRLGEDPEGVHQARVGTRRLRSDLRTFGPLLDPVWVDALRADLKWVADALGAVRDADVLLERLSQASLALPEADRGHAARLLGRLEKERAADRKRLLAVLDDPRYVELLDRLVDAARQPRLAPDADAPAAETLPKRVRKPWRKLNKSVAELGPEPADADLHQVRIRAKRARYAAEAVVPAVGGPARRLAARIAELQGVLGDHQDAVVAADWLRSAAIRASRAEAVAAGQLIAIEREQADETRRKWPKAWKRAAKPKHSRWLG